ncbi:MAG: hypothetical protein IJN54_16150 [Lachnospiraceae bacterium]|nr:hypothetical protein [Lachnospiraceae bacterium]
MFELFRESIRVFLQSNGVDICDYNYKESDNYKKIKNTKIWGVGGISISLEEFIERFLLTRQEVFDTYESKYDMGSAYEFDDNECEDVEVAKEIITILNLAFKNDIEAEAEEFVNKFYRKKGLIERLRTSLCVDLELFDKDNIRCKRERCKILYFFYMLEHYYFPDTNVLMLLNKPSMENIDNSFIGMKTYNGMVIKFIKDSLEKELFLPVKEEIKGGVAQIVLKWDEIMENAYLLMDFLYEKGYDYDFEETIRLLLTDSERVKVNNILQYTYSPIETLYLKMTQYEYIGNIQDIIKLNNIQKEYDFKISPELVEEMKNLHYKLIDIENVERFIEEDALRISKYVYLKPEVSKEEVRRIRKSKGKVHKWIEFCARAKPMLSKEDIANELQIVSVLQAIILDDKNETFNYSFHGWQKYMKHMPQVQGGLKNDKHVLDALQCYWVRKVTDRWYANIGRADVRTKTRALEQVCDNILLKILTQSNLDEMRKVHEFYLSKLDDGLITTRKQISAVKRLTSYLKDKGFEYVDEWYIIRYIFLFPPEIEDIYQSLIAMINYVIQTQESTLELKDIEVFDASGKERLEVSFELFFDYKSNKCIMQEFKLV